MVDQSSDALSGNKANARSKLGSSRVCRSALELISVFPEILSELLLLLLLYAPLPYAPVLP